MLIGLLFVVRFLKLPVHKSKEQARSRRVAESRNLPVRGGRCGPDPSLSAYSDRARRNLVGTRRMRARKRGDDCVSCVLGAKVAIFAPLSLSSLRYLCRLHSIYTLEFGPSDWTDRGAVCRRVSVWAEGCPAHRRRGSQRPVSAVRLWLESRPQGRLRRS